MSYRSCKLDGSPVERTCGVLIDRSGERARIHLFQTEGSDIFNLEHTGPIICQRILEQIDPEGNLSDYDWGCTAGFAHTDIRFDEMDGWITGMTLSNPITVRIGGARTLEDYQAVVDSPEGFLKALNGEQPQFYSEARSWLVLPLPRHEDGFLTLSKEGLSGSGQRIILADREKLMKRWQQSVMRQAGAADANQLRRSWEANAKSMGGDDNPIPPFHSGVKASTEHVQPWKGYPDQLPIATYRPPATAVEERPRGGLMGLFGAVTRVERNRPEAIDFVNGRHRTINFANLGAPFIPLVMDDTDDTRAFEQMFGYRQIGPAQAARESSPSEGAPSGGPSCSPA
ncbi:MAG: hypothetical protein EOM26_11915 [Alphaproteobacteria bacterium]|nr:hypothetical protein [Alphaproteobacteria bacterium]